VGEDCLSGTVIHAGFKLKLLGIGVGNLFYKITKNMYEVSNAAVRCNNHITNFMPLTLGVKQGDNLSQIYSKFLLMIFQDILINV
jgi:hypothetical protein